MTSTEAQLSQISEKLELIVYLLRTGGKDSRVYERVPLWTESDCDMTCPLCGLSLPKEHSAMLSGVPVHPGAAVFAEERGYDFDKAQEIGVPEDYLVTPYEIQFRERYRPPTIIKWDVSELSKMRRPALMLLANHMGMKAALEEEGHEIDFRGQSNSWVRAALKALKARDPLPKPVKPRKRKKHSAKAVDVPTPAEPEPKRAEIARSIVIRK